MVSLKLVPLKRVLVSVDIDESLAELGSFVFLGGVADCVRFAFLTRLFARSQ